MEDAYAALKIFPPSSTRALSAPGGKGWDKGVFERAFLTARSGTQDRRSRKIHEKKQPRNCRREPPQGYPRFLRGAYDGAEYDLGRKLVLPVGEDHLPDQGRNGRLLGAVLKKSYFASDITKSKKNILKS